MPSKRKWNIASVCELVYKLNWCNMLLSLPMYRSSRTFVHTPSPSVFYSWFHSFSTRVVECWVTWPGLHDWNFFRTVGVPGDSLWSELTECQRTKLSHQEKKTFQWEGDGLVVTVQGRWSKSYLFKSHYHQIAMVGPLIKAINLKLLKLVFSL